MRSHEVFIVLYLIVFGCVNPKKIVYERPVPQVTRIFRNDGRYFEKVNLKDIHLINAAKSGDTLSFEDALLVEDRALYSIYIPKWSGSLSTPTCSSELLFTKVISQTNETGKLKFFLNLKLSDSMLNSSMDGFFAEIPITHFKSRDSKRGDLSKESFALDYYTPPDTLVRDFVLKFPLDEFVVQRKEKTFLINVPIEKAALVEYDSLLSEPREAALTINDINQCSEKLFRFQPPKCCN